MTLTANSVVSEGLLDTASARYQATVITTSAVTTTLTASSTFYQMCIGSTAGQVLQLPDATTITAGWTYIVWNTSSANISVTDGAEGALVTLYPLDTTTIALQTAGTQAGTWVLDRTATAGVSAMTVAYWGKASKNFYLSGGVSSTVTSDSVPIRFPRGARIIGFAADNSLSPYYNYILKFREVSNLGVDLASVNCAAGRYNGLWNPSGICTFTAGQGLSLYTAAGSDNATVTVSVILFFLWT